MMNPEARRAARGSSPSSRSSWAPAVLATLMCATAASAQEPPSGWEEMVASEEAIVQVSPHIKRLGHSTLNLHLPDESTRTVFGDVVKVVDLVAVERPGGNALGVVGRSSHDPAASNVSRRDLALWRPLLDRVDYFEHARFQVIRGQLSADDPGRLETDLGFEALARVPDGRLWLRGDLTVTWAAGAPLQEDGPPTWSIVEWRTGELRTMAADRLLFAEVLDQVLEPEALVPARRSIHEEFVLEYLLDPDGFQLPTPYFDPQSADRHPGVAVTDVNGDGFDDVYVMARWGQNQFFQNQGDGTFEEVAAGIGLGVSHFTSSALFADFDNDGDQDVFLGRTLEPSVYLVNEGGRFVDRSLDLFDSPLPALVSSVSAVDYDGDGLLDLYVSTYAAALHPIETTAFLDQQDGQHLWALATPGGENHVIKNKFGPPNVLLRNRGGGRFARVEDTALNLFRNTYQSTWADYDNDGDMDVYVVNDFASNNLFRNDGRGAFTDVTAATRTADLGFGMGASWGDYDGDGLQDLYVTNMHSKAGRRIAARLKNIDETFGRMARGNTLFRNGKEGFEQVSGLEPPGLLVEAAGWGWGSQFLDLDNDSDLDIHALSGFYTAPSAVELPIDI
ncbi:MAG: VCBS repeat-containing protein [Gammaproteobacteria bacterium]|nr:VCBS repeat-containing protein [Gammaproteobacteria bacterium]MYF62025.1 VCBS repeat-containing protein [Gammaproteobacteria bacterium]MYI22360.1 VCBS repeat-containing protein [Gammaproteobacteria bacterium]